MTRTFNGTSSPCPTPTSTGASRRCGRPKWPQGRHRTWPTAPSTKSKGAPDPSPPLHRIEGANHRIRDPSHPPVNDPSRGPQPPTSASAAGGRRTIPERRALPSTRSAPTATAWATSPPPADRRGPPNPVRPEPSPRGMQISRPSTRRPPSVPPWTSLQEADSSPSSLKWTPGPHLPSCPGPPSGGTSRRPDYRHRAYTSRTTTDPPSKGTAAGSSPGSSTVRWPTRTASTSSKTQPMQSSGRTFSSPSRWSSTATSASSRRCSRNQRAT